MRQCLLLGFVTLAFGLAARQLADTLSPFALAHLAVGATCLLVAAALGARRVARGSGAGTDGGRRAVASGTLGVAAALLVAGVATIGTERPGLRLDLTFERIFEPAEATVRALERLGPALRMTLYVDPGDPRVRRTRLLLDRLSAVAGAQVETRTLRDDLEDIDRYGVGASNSVVLVRTDAPATRPFSQRRHWELVERPTEGALFEALTRLTDPATTRIYALVGTGEGDLSRTDERGFSGLARAIQTEGYELVPLPSAFLRDVPPDARALVAIAPERRLSEAAVGALRRYLAGGGRLLAFIEPGTTSGLEEILAEYGMHSPDAWVVDPASADIEGAAPGLSPIAFHYGEHPVTRGLDRNRVTFFQGARALELSKPRPDDRLRRAVTTSGEAWLRPGSAAPRGPHAPEPPDGVRRDYRTLVGAGEYPREQGPATRIVAFGDSDAVSNRYLRALFNLDLVMNALHWVAQRESEITLRPKAAATIQFPLPVQSSLTAFYGVGLLIPELLLLTGGLVWLRQRGA